MKPRFPQNVFLFGRYSYVRRFHQSSRRNLSSFINNIRSNRRTFSSTGGGSGGGGTGDSNGNSAMRFSCPEQRWLLSLCLELFMVAVSMKTRR
ncbi:hypothetical protein HID58_001865 [Brassica napus]|uniref:Uncharacterized protein n=1 Tax=Brassica napus TaxID=3708 RepID=A0ABQ8EL66_BRANA|nr:hypothetical protein HID58_001865 [Brassica napus]